MCTLPLVLRSYVPSFSLVCLRLEILRLCLWCPVGCLLRDWEWYHLLTKVAKDVVITEGDSSTDELVPQVTSSDSYSIWGALPIWLGCLGTWVFHYLLPIRLNPEVVRSRKHLSTEPQMSYHRKTNQTRHKAALRWDSINSIALSSLSHSSVLPFLEFLSLQYLRLVVWGNPICWARLSPLPKANVLSSRTEVIRKVPYRPIEIYIRKVPYRNIPIEYRNPVIV